MSTQKLPIRAVMVSVLYHDYLTVTLPRALSLLESVTVITTPEDSQTREVCRQNGIDPVISNEFHEGARIPFDKGRALDTVLRTLPEGWVLLLDADILLPKDFSPFPLDQESIHGCSRRRVVGSEQLAELEAGRTDFPLMRHQTVDGVPVPIGFFQLFHKSNGRPDGHPPALTNGHGDLELTLLWDENRRIMLPLDVWHLDSVISPTGANWHGRVTPLFT